MAVERAVGHPVAVAPRVRDERVTTLALAGGCSVCACHRVGPQLERCRRLRRSRTCSASPRRAPATKPSQMPDSPTAAATGRPGRPSRSNRRPLAPARAFGAHTAKLHAVHAVAAESVSSEDLPQPAVAALAEQVEIDRPGSAPRAVPWRQESTGRLRSPPMRVAMLSWEFPPLVVGGLAAHVDGLSRAMARAGHEVVVLTLHHPDVADDYDDRRRARPAGQHRPAVAARRTTSWPG